MRYNLRMEQTNPYPDTFFARYDPSNDYNFYFEPRLVVHIDDAAIETLTALYGELLPTDGTILDLMSSWRSHLPKDVEYDEVVGLGMNDIEMAENGQLNEHHIHNLNVEATLPFDAGRFDAVLCAVSVQYLIRPLDVFADVYRVLKPGGLFVVSFSNRCFPTKAINGWLESNDQQHIAIVASYFQFSAEWEQPHTRIKALPNSDPLFMLWARKPHD